MISRSFAGSRSMHTCSWNASSFAAVSSSGVGDGVGRSGASTSHWAWRRRAASYPAFRAIVKSHPITLPRSGR